MRRFLRSCADVTPEPDEREDEDRQLEDEAQREQRQRDEREVVARPDLDVVEVVVEGGQERQRARQHDEVGEDDAGREEAGRERDEDRRRPAATCSSTAGARKLQSW